MYNMNNLQVVLINYFNVYQSLYDHNQMDIVLFYSDITAFKNLSKTDTFQRQTLQSAPKGVRLRGPTVFLDISVFLYNYPSNHKQHLFTVTTIDIFKVNTLLRKEYQREGCSFLFIEEEDYNTNFC